MRAVKHHGPRTLDDALALLAKYGGQAALLAGGTDLIISLRKTGGQPEALQVVDLSGIDELRSITVGDDRIALGACVTHTQVEQDATLRALARLLPEACSQIGSLQIRNRGTLGGNLCNASACADSVPPLIALGATVVLQSERGPREIRLSELITAPYRTVIEPDELLTHIRFFRPAPGTGSAFVKLGRRNALSVSRMSVAVLLTLDEDERVIDPRVAAGSVAPVPRRFGKVEESLAGRAWSESLAEEAGALLAEEMIENSGRRWSTPYKEPAVAALLRRALGRAVAEARGADESGSASPAVFPVSKPRRRSEQGAQPPTAPNVSFALNCREVEVSVPANWTLLQLLRDKLLLTGTKCGCEIGECGACTVILDGEAVNSCLILAPQVHGRSVTTVEGLAAKVHPSGAGLHPLQRAFLDQDAVACGFCTPGVLMSAKALLDRRPRPTRHEIKVALSGNLCRCTGYIPIVAAVEQAARDLEDKGDARPED